MNIYRKIRLNVIWNRGILSFGMISIILISVALIPYFSEIPKIGAKPVKILPISINISGEKKGLPVLRVYYPTKYEKPALMLARGLAKNLKGLNEYSRVEVIYFLGISTRDRILKQRHPDEKFDLFLIKERELEKVNDIGIQYTSVAKYPSYGVYLISKNTEPKLDGDYLHNKKLGLLADTASESGYQYPMKIIRSQVNEEKYPIFENYYSTHRNLRVALENDEVDVIGSFWGEYDKKNHPSWKTLKIAEIPVGHQWYFDGNIHSEDVICVIKDALIKVSLTQKNDYWRNIIIDVCKK